MSRVLDLNLRQQPVGGQVRKNVDIKWSASLADESHLVILVHGFNVTLDEACRAYECYIQRLPKKFPVVLRVFWPGDEDWSILRPLYYPWALDPAKEAAHELLNAIKRVRKKTKGKPYKVTFVAHSLGCRLVTELLEAISVGYSNDWPEVELICMMAAAVPSGMGERGGELRKALDGLVRPDGFRSDKLMVLFSPNDLVLRNAFIPGQAVSRRRKRKGMVETTRAIGLYGEPVDLTERRYHVMDAGHSDYWPSYEAIMYVGTYLLIPVPRETARKKIKVRKTPRAWKLAGRKISQHKIGTASVCDYYEKQ